VAKFHEDGWKSGIQFCVLELAALSICRESGTETLRRYQRAFSARSGIYLDFSTDVVFMHRSMVTPLYGQ
jgi:hypothetical protein